MPINEKQKKERQKYLGSSDASAVLGMDPWKSPTDLWLEKTGQVIEEDKTSDALEVGTFCEEAVLRWFSQKKKLPIITQERGAQPVRIHKNGIMMAHFDALVKNDPTQIIEAKTTGVTGAPVSEEWGEVETDEVPDRIKIQVMHQMAILPLVQITWIPVLIGGVGLRHYKVERDEEMIAEITDAEEAFWRKHILENVAPGDVANLSVLKRIKRIPNKTVPVEDDLIRQWIKAKQVFQIAEKEKEQSFKLLLSAIGDAEAATCSFGTLTYLEYERNGYSVGPSKFRKANFKERKEI